MAEHKSIASALAAAQSQMGKALKDSVNPHFRNKYADLGNVMDACLPALNENGIALLQPFFDDENGRYVKTIFIHGPSGESLECRVPLIVGKNDMQGFGSAATYARRYGLMAMAGIAPDDDDGNAAAKAAPKEERRQQPKTRPAQEKEAAPEMTEEERTAKSVAWISEAKSMDELAARFASLKEHHPRIADSKDVDEAYEAKRASFYYAGGGYDEIPYDG